MITDSPTVSVVVPAYNQEHYLPDALHSILAQTYRDYEIIVVDDGSTDETSAVARSFGSAIRYIRQENQGLAGARNTGIRHARGEYVALLDSDDCWLPDFLQTMMTVVAEQPDGVVYYSGWRYMDAKGQNLLQAPSSQMVSPENMYRTLLKANFLIPSTIIMRRLVVLAAGLFDPDFRRLQDWELWVRLLRQGYNFIGTSACLVRYRIHDSSLSTDPAGGQRAALALVEKHFGPDDGQPSTWPEEKRYAYGGAYRACALTALIRQHDWMVCAQYLRTALQADPSLACDLDLFYELALGTQPLGYRGTPDKIELAANAEHICHLLANLFQPSEAAALASLRRQSTGTAFYALGLVASNLGHFPLGRYALGKALISRPDLFRHARFWRTFIKLTLGYDGYQRLRTLRKAFVGA